MKSSGKAKHAGKRTSPVAELLGFPEEEQGALSQHLEKLGVIPYWSGRNPHGENPDLRVLRLGVGSLPDQEVKQGAPLILISDPYFHLNQFLLDSLGRDLVWFGGWTADTFTLARRIASIAHRHLEKNPPAAGGKPAVLDCDQNGMVLSVTQSSAARLGGVPSDFVGKTWFSWLEKGRQQLVQLWMKEKAASFKGRGLSDCLVRLSDRRWSFWDIWIHPRAEGLRVYLADESERKELGGQLEYALTHDALTGLLNRWELRRRMEKHSKKGDGILLMIDLDDFKIFNDTRGHDEGDEMLCRVAQHLRDHFGPEADLARLGGDEFAVFMKGNQMKRVTQSARKLIASLARRRHQNGSAIEPSLSVGLVRACQGDTPAHVFRAVEAGLRRAKLLGKTRLEIIQDHRVNSPSERLAWTREVSQALQAGDFELWLQPVRELQKGKVILHEALFRLWTPGGLIMPTTALPAADRLGMRTQLASMVMHRCLELLQKDPFLRLSANIGREMLCDANLARDLISSVRVAKIDPSRLILEVSEDTGFSELRSGTALAEKLRRAGFLLALDDYGRGAANLNEIVELPISMVKLDPILWRDSHQNIRKKWFVKRMLQLFHDLKIWVVAIGVASRSDLALVRSLGIANAQGIELGKPHPTKISGPGISRPLVATQRPTALNRPDSFLHVR